MRKIKRMLAEDLSSRVPTDFVSKRVSFKDVSGAIELFLNENFTGGILVESYVDSTQSGNIYPDGLAYLFRELLRRVFTDSIIKVRLYMQNGELKIKVNWGDNVTLTSETVEHLTEIAERSGFYVSFGKNYAYVSIEEESSKALFVYATDFNTVVRSFVDIFFN